MRTLQRNKRKLYLCKKNIVNNLLVYSSPIVLYEDYMPTNSSGDLLAIGENYPNYLRIKTTNLDGTNFHAGDRLYIFVTPPTVHDTLCLTTDYEVDNQPIPTLNITEIILRKLSGK